MGFIIWYKLKFREEQPSGGLLSQLASALPIGNELPMTVSNDVFGGKYILDADITLTMLGGATADSFAITLTNLPEDAANELKKQQKALAGKNQLLLADINLGYFDEDSSKSDAKAIMTGVVTSVKTSVTASGDLETEINGQELGGYKLRKKCNVSINKQDSITADDIVKKILIGDQEKGKQDTGVRVANGSHLDIPPLKNYTLQAKNALEALRQFANDRERKISLPIVIRDNTLFIGPSVGREEAIHFAPKTNIVKMDAQQDTDQDDTPCLQDQDSQSQVTPPRESFEVIALGHPDLRVGQRAFLDVEKPPSGTLRIGQLVHSFSTRSGYTCKVTVVSAEQGKVAPELVGASGVVSRFRDVIEGTQSQKPAIDVGQIKEYQAGNQQKHLTTLNYGQSPSADAVAPSVEVKVDETTQLHSKPISAPFAWYKCGLIVPVYQGMRALLAHNRGSVNDAIVTGFLWSEEPQHEFARPKNEDGDYWLCLPTELDSNTEQPTGKGVNDLTDKSGLRTIQAKGLHIFVGDKKLPAVGERPDVPDAQTIVIEHESGTKITIGSDGAVKIEAAQGKEIALTNGGVTLKLGSSGVEVS